MFARVSVFSHVAFVSTSDAYTVAFTKVKECGGMTFITDLLVRKLLVEYRYRHSDDLDVKEKQMKRRMWLP
jgi:hypothetical protein